MTNWSFYNIFEVWRVPLNCLSYSTLTMSAGDKVSADHPLPGVRAERGSRKVVHGRLRLLLQVCEALDRSACEAS